MKINQKGLSAVEGLLLVVIAAIIGFTGWYVGHTQSSTNKTLTSDNSTTPSFKKKAKSNNTDITADWTAYTSTLGKFSLKHPKAWVTAAHPELCSNSTKTGIYMLAPNTASVGACATEGSGEMSVTWQTDKTSCEDLDSSTWKQESKETVTVSGVSATKITATANAPGEGLGLPPEGTKTVQYCLVSNGVMYTADYQQQPNYPDVLNDFNTMVTKTFKLN